MAKCAQCKHICFFNLKKSGDKVFCGDKCLQEALLEEACQRVDSALLQREIEAIFRGPCPRCSKQNGPVDIRRRHEVVSMLIITKWSTLSEFACKSCASKRQVASLLFSGVAGWWGFPFGLIVTPVQILRNGAEILKKNPLQPSPELHRAVQVQLATQTRSTAPPSVPQVAPR